MLATLTKLYKKYQNKVDEEGMREANKSAIRYVIKHLIGRPVKRIVRPITQPPIIYYHSRFGDRWNVLNKDWDLLIILDTCRPDALHQLRHEYDFINNVDSVWRLVRHRRSGYSTHSTRNTRARYLTQRTSVQIHTPIGYSKTTSTTPISAIQN